MLSLLFVQICAGVALAATCVGILLGRRRSPGSKEPARVMATRTPARGTEALWVLGTLVAVFWGVGVFIAPPYAYHYPGFPDFAGSWIVQVIGVVLSVGGGFLFSSAAQTLGPQMTPAIQLRQGHQLVQTGPYRYIRHPVYTAIILVAIGQTLFFFSLPVALLTLLLGGLAVYRARLEEGLLASPEGFGEIYEAYVARTGRFLPRFRSTR